MCFWVYPALFSTLGMPPEKAVRTVAATSPTIGPRRPQFAGRGTDAIPPLFVRHSGPRGENEAGNTGGVLLLMLGMWYLDFSIRFGFVWCDID